jgi:hypothetical protein
MSQLHTSPGPLDIATDRRKMHFDRSINLGNLLTIVTMVGGLMVVYGKFEARISVLEIAITHQQQVDRRHEAEVELLRREIREDLKDIKADQRRVTEFIEKRLTGPQR